MSSPIYSPIGQVLQDGIVFRDVNGVAITGKTQADFTLALSKNGVGNQPTTGITLTEVDAIHNPGEYQISVGLSGFIAALGEYHLTITYTADTKYAWEQVYYIAAGSTYLSAGSSFTSATGNGRVTDGTNVQSGVLVVVTDSGDNVIGAFRTNYQGNWGPVFFSVDGTYTATAQSANYASVSGTITVSSGIVTGPGTDLVLGAATASPMSAAELWAYFTRQARDVSGDKAFTERQQGVQDALDMVAREAKWNWLLRRGYLTLHGPQQVSLVLTNGSDIATLTTSTFPSWAGTGRFFVTNQVIDIAEYIDSVTVRLATVWNRPTVAGQNAVLFKDEYDMPQDMLAFHQLIPGPRWGYGGTNVGPELFYQNQSAAVFGQPIASCWCLHHGKLLLYPYPSQETQILFTYYLRPGMLAGGGDVADFDPTQIELVRRAIDFQVSVRYGSCAGANREQSLASYKEALHRALENDKDATVLPNLLESVSPWDARLGRTMYQRRTYPPPPA